MEESFSWKLIEVLPFVLIFLFFAVLTIVSNKEEGNPTVTDKRHR